MSRPIPHVVYDCVVFVQALISGRGPAARCVEQVKAGRAILLLSPDVLNEIGSVPLRPELTGKYTHLTPQRVSSFIQEIQRLAVLVHKPAKTIPLPRDPKDQPYLDLAAGADADYLVTWNVRHLTYLMNRDTPEGRELETRFPRLRIVDPPTFLREIE